MSRIEEGEPFPIYDHSSDPDFGVEEEEEELPLQRHSLRARRPVYYGIPTARQLIDSDSGSDSDSFVAKKQLSRRKRATKSPAVKKRKRAKRPVVVLPEDVPWKEPREENPDVSEAAVTTISQSPSVAFLVIFIQTFADLFSDFPEIVGPREIEQGLVTPAPSALMERLFVRLLGLVLNRKKEVEVGRYGSALSELHAQLPHLGVGEAFPPLNWKSKDAFAELEKWEDRLELLHVLVHWSLANSDRVRTLLSDLDEEYAKPWLGIGPENTKFYLVEGANEMRVYKETSTLLSVVAWKEVASSAADVKELVRSLWPSLIPPEPEPETPVVNGEPNGEPNGELKTESEEPKAEHKVETEEPKEGSNEETKDEANENEDAEEEEEEPQEEPQPEEEEELTEAQQATKTLAQALLDLIPEFEAQEAARVREAKRLRRRDELARHAEFLKLGGARTRTRRTEIDFAKMFAGNESDSDSSPRRGRGRHNLRNRDNGWEPQRESQRDNVVVEESREERYARLERARAAARDAEEAEMAAQVAAAEAEDAEMEVEVENELAEETESATPTPQAVQSEPPQVEPVKPVEPVQPVQPPQVQPVQPVEPVQAVQPVQQPHVQPVQPLQSVHPAQPVPVPPQSRTVPSSTSGHELNRSFPVQQHPLIHHSPVHHNPALENPRLQNPVLQGPVLQSQGQFGSQPQQVQYQVPQSQVPYQTPPSQSYQTGQQTSYQAPQNQVAYQQHQPPQVPQSQAPQNQAPQNQVPQNQALPPLTKFVPPTMPFTGSYPQGQPNGTNGNGQNYQPSGN